MSKATLIEFWRDLILRDEALERYKVNRPDAVARYDLTEAERLSLLNDDYAALYKRGVPVELLFQGILLAGLDPREYMRKLHSGLNYTGRGLITAETAAPSHSGSWTPSA
jgi:hypothetical protein